MKCKTKKFDKCGKTKVLLVSSILITQLAVPFIKVNGVNTDYKDEQSDSYYMYCEDDIMQANNSVDDTMLSNENSENGIMLIANNDEADFSLNEENGEIGSSETGNDEIGNDEVGNGETGNSEVTNGETVNSETGNDATNEILISSDVIEKYLYNVLKYISNLEEEELQSTAIEKTILYESGYSLEHIIEDIINNQKEYLNTLSNEDFIKVIYNGILLWEPCTEQSRFEGRYYENILYEEAINKLTINSETEDNTSQLVNGDETEGSTTQSTTDVETEETRYKWVLEDVLKYDKFELLKEQMSENPEFNFEIIQQGKLNLSSRNKGDINAAQLGINANDALTLQQALYERTELGGNRYEDYVSTLDVDESGIVDTDDAICIATYVGRGYLQEEDLNNDGIVNFEDFVISYNKEIEESKSSILMRFLLNVIS